VGVNPQFDDFVCGAGFRWIRGCHGFLRSRILVPLNNLMSSSRQEEAVKTVLMQAELVRKEWA
jgi:hypothetical protein